MKKLISFILILIILLSAVPVASAYEPKQEVISNQAILISPDSDTVIYEKNADEQTPATTLAKIMTAVLAFESNDNPAAVNVTASKEGVHANDGTWVVHYDIKENQQYSLLDLIYIMMYTSANDAANIIAVHIGGSINGFVQKMNEKAAEIGMGNTNYVNPTGLDKQGGYTTARDIAKLTKYAMNIPMFQTLSKGVSYEIKKNSTHGGNTIFNDCELIPTKYYNKYAYDYATGVKSGATEESGFCVSASATLDGTTYIAVVLGGKKTTIDGTEYTSALVDARRLFRWAFSDFKMKVIVTDSTIVDEVPVKLSSSEDYVSLVPSQSIARLVPGNVDPSTIIIKPIDKPEYVNAPVKKGDYICKAQIIHAGEVLMTIDLVAYADVSVSVPRYILYGISKAFTSPIAIVLIIVILIAILIYIYIQQDRKKKRKRERERAIRQQILNKKDDEE